MPPSEATATTAPRRSLSQPREVSSTDADTGSSKSSQISFAGNSVASGRATPEDRSAAMQTPATRRDFLAAGAAGLTAAFAGYAFAQDKDAPADLILINGRMTTLDQRRPSASAVAIKGGRFVAVGDDQDV